jgi:hypothetical protein
VLLSIWFLPSSLHANRARLTQEQIVCVWTVPSNLEDLDHVKELPMNVTNHCHRSLDVYDIALLHEQLFRLGAYRLNDRVREQLFLV